MTIEASVPGERAPGRAGAVRALPQRAAHGRHPLITASRGDAAPRQPRGSPDRAGALARAAGQAA
jgi:hypothetical protein